MLLLKNRFLSRRYIRKILFKKEFSTEVTGTNIKDNIVSSSSTDIDIPDGTVTDLVFAKMEQFHKYPAAECLKTGKKYTFAEVRSKSRNLSRALRKNWKFQPGDAVAVLLSNSPDFFVASLAIWEAGLILSTLNPTFNADEIAKQLMDSPTRLIITQQESFNEVRKACRQLKRHVPILCIKQRENDDLPEGAINFEQLMNTKVDCDFTHKVRQEDVAFLPYSSGTTGLPKGVEITHRNLIATICQTLHPDFTYVTPPTDTHQDICAAIIPMFHIYGFTLIFLNGLTTGMKTVTFPRFTPEYFLSGLKHHKINVLHAAPALILFLTHNPDVKPEYLHSLKYVVTGGAPLGYPDEEKFLQKIGRPFILNQGYGLTETTGIVTIMSSQKIDRSLNNVQGSAGGTAPSTLIKIINIDDPKGIPLKAHETGEVLVKGPQVMKGYFNKPDQTSQAFLDGWFRTGDIGHYNESGLLFITDRLKELIKVKGFQVAPAELEYILRDHPRIQDAAVIGIPHPTFGEVPRAYVVKKGDATLNTDDVAKFVEGKVSKLKHLLGGVEEVDAIPRSLSGKILRRLLKSKYMDRNSNKSKT